MRPGHAQKCLSPIGKVDQRTRPSERRKGVYGGTLFDPEDQKMRERYWVPAPPAEK